MATHALATWASSLQYTDIPAPVRRSAVRSFYNWAGCAIGGSRHPTVAKAARALRPFMGPATSTVLGYAQNEEGGPSRTDAQHAALLNGIASHVHDYDDTHLATIIHPTGPVASALLAVAEWKGGVSGREFVTALVAGVEVECKLGLAVWPQHYDIGWHITSTCGGLGAAVAVGRLLGLKTIEMQHAIGVAATQVTGLREFFGSDTKSFHPGRAAQNGLLAAVLAAEGYTSSLQGLEAKRGWANCVSTRNNLHEIVEGLGRGQWEIEKNAFKPFPCGIVCHPAIDACIRLRQDVTEEGLEISTEGDTAVKSVQLTVHPLVLELTSKRTPKDGLEGKFSVFHGCAVALIYGKASPAQYADEIVQNGNVIAVRDRINAVADDSLAADATIAVLELNNGRIIERRVQHAVGSLDVPMTEQQLEEKFLDQCLPVLGEVARRASAACWKLEEVDDISSITKLL